MEMFALYPSGARSSHSDASATCWIHCFTYPKLQDTLDPSKPPLCRHCRHRGERGTAMSGISFHYTPLRSISLHSIPHIRLAAKARELVPLRSTRSLALRTITINKKVRKCSPQAVPCKGLSALRARSIKISTLRSLRSLRVVFLSAQP